MTERFTNETTFPDPSWTKVQQVRRNDLGMFFPPIREAFLGGSFNHREGSGSQGFSDNWQVAWGDYVRGFNRVLICCPEREKWVEFIPVFDDSNAYRLLFDGIISRSSGVDSEHRMNVFNPEMREYEHGISTPECLTLLGSFDIFIKKSD